MKICVVGNGPTAKGKGREIDAADFVVRIKAWWVHGAADAGRRCDATAWYGDLCGWDTVPKPLRCQHWFTHALGVKPLQERLRTFSAQAGIQVIRWLPASLFDHARQHLGFYPTTGFVAVVMALAIYSHAELWLYGFDSCGQNEPNFDDARRTLPRSQQPSGKMLPGCHNHLREKQVFAELLEGTWLGEKVDVRLKWHAMPDFGEVAQ